MATLNGPFSYRGGTPSVNLPGVPFAQSTMAGIGQRALENTSVAEAIARGQNQSALGYAEALEDAERDAIRREMARGQQDEERFGGGVIFGNTSAGEREQRLARRRLHRDFQSQQEKYSLAEAQQKQRAMEYALGLEAQGATLDVQSAMQAEQLAARERLQMQLAQLQATQRQLDRQATKELADARNNLDRQRIANEYKLRRAQIIVQMKSVGEQIAASKFRRGGLGGGLQVTSSVLSPGGSGRPGMNPASRHAWG